MDFVAFNDTNEKSFVNLTFTAKRDVGRIYISFIFNMKSDPYKKEYDARVFETNIDTCKVGEGLPFANILVDFLLAKFQNYSNFRLKCPQKKGDFYIHSFPAPDVSAVTFANIFHVNGGQWEIILVVRVKLTAKSSAERSFSIKLRGSTIMN